MIYLIALCGFCFAIFRELSEHAKENGFKGWPKWWNTGTAHRNKHEWGAKLGLPKWVFKSVLVWTTDAEHFFQLLSTLSVVTVTYLLAGKELALAFYVGNVLAGFSKNFTSLK